MYFWLALRQMAGLRAHIAAKIDEAQLRAMQDMSYPELAYEIVSPFIGDCISETDLRPFSRTPTQALGTRQWHPWFSLTTINGFLSCSKGRPWRSRTCASVTRSLARSRVGSTRRKSRDHGCDIGRYGQRRYEGCKRCDNIDIFILHPHERVSEVQRVR